MYTHTHTQAFMTTLYVCMSVIKVPPVNWQQRRAPPHWELPLLLDSRRSLCPQTLRFVNAGVKAPLYWSEQWNSKQWLTWKCGSQLTSSYIPTRCFLSPLFFGSTSVNVHLYVFFFQVDQSLDELSNLPKWSALSEETFLWTSVWSKQLWCYNTVNQIQAQFPTCHIPINCITCHH